MRHRQSPDRSWRVLSHCMFSRCHSCSPKSSIAHDDWPRRGVTLDSLAWQKLSDECADLRSVSLQGEVPRVKEVDLCVGDIFQEGLCACRTEERVTVSPDGQNWRPHRAQVLLPA